MLFHQSMNIMQLAKKDEVLRPAIYGGIGLLCALCGFGLVVLASHFGFRPLVDVGAMIVVGGLAGGLMSILWGWISLFWRQRG
ncbi:hypothetical protein DVT68_13250 [Dyella solisilvae]|uniref:Uncharacterized protein n=1 Tax=Dyella solisilvae TaxID=1920168 RepID=A0A370K5Y7_9GAMM|nr:hypothetical protein DVT68_13250 [Dyella solisilvae]